MLILIDITLTPHQRIFFFCSRQRLLKGINNWPECGECDFGMPNYKLEIYNIIFTSKGQGTSGKSGVGRF